MGRVYGRVLSKERGVATGLGMLIFIELFQLFVLKDRFASFLFVFFENIMAHIVFKLELSLAVRSITIYISYGC